jgi:vacuolar-type H+-ATPase subunit H
MADELKPNPTQSGLGGRWTRLPTWAKWTIGVVGGIVLLGLGVGIGASGSKEDELKSEMASLESKLHGVSSQLEAEESVVAEAEAKAQKVYDERDKMLSDAEAEAKQIVGSAKNESETLQGKVSDRESELEQAEGELSNVEESLSGVREEKRLSSIPGNGTYQAEVDFLPGTYRSSGGSGCYWATLNSADPYDIASNENATGPTIASIQSPYFQTEGCGKWERIGE